MFPSLDFEEAWVRVMVSLIPKQPHPKGLNEFRPIICVMTFRKLQGCRTHCRQSLGNRTNGVKTPPQTVHMIERSTEIAREWNMRIFCCATRSEERFWGDVSRQHCCDVASQKPERTADRCPQVVGAAFTGSTARTRIDRLSHFSGP